VDRDEFKNHTYIARYPLTGMDKIALSSRAFIGKTPGSDTGELSGDHRAQKAKALLE
jgi:hypothetical protein